MPTKCIVQTPRARQIAAPARSARCRPPSAPATRTAKLKPTYEPWIAKAIESATSTVHGLLACPYPGFFETEYSPDGGARGEAPEGVVPGRVHPANSNNPFGSAAPGNARQNPLDALFHDRRPEASIAAGGLEGCSPSAAHFLWLREEGNKPSARSAAKYARFVLAIFRNSCYAFLTNRRGGGTESEGGMEGTGGGSRKLRLNALWRDDAAGRTFG